MSKQLTVNDVIDTLGYTNIVNLGNKIGNRYFQPAGLQKYIQEKLSVAHYLNLHKSKGKSLIDIGTGAGWFPYICKLYGHNCIGTDFLNRNEYQPIYDWLELDIREELVYSKVSFGLNDKVDYIVGLRSFFPNRPKIWEVDEWKFFFKDISKNIKQDGGLYLGCNAGSTRGKYRLLNENEKSHWGPLELKNMFKDFHVPHDKNLKIKQYTLYIPYNEILKLGEVNE